MSHFKVCPRCGAHLDPGEVCDCLDTEAQVLIDHVTDKKTARGATNTTDGKAEKVLTGSDSASSIQKN